MTKWWSVLVAHCCCPLLLLASSLVVCDNSNNNRDNRGLSRTRPLSVSDVSIPSIAGGSNYGNGPSRESGGERRRNSKQMLWPMGGPGHEARGRASAAMATAAQVRGDQWVGGGVPSGVLPASSLPSGKSMSRYSISPTSCIGNNGQAGVCMFNYQCTQNRGTILGTCVENFLFGACCGGLDPLYSNGASLNVEPPSGGKPEQASIDAESALAVNKDAEKLQSDLDSKPVEASAPETVTPVSDDELYSMVSKIVDMSSNHSTDRPLPNYFNVEPVLLSQNSIVYNDFYLEKSQEQDIEKPVDNIASDVEDTTSPAGDISLFSGKNETHGDLQSFWTHFFQKQHLIPTSDFKNFDNLTVDEQGMRNSTTVTPGTNLTPVTNLTTATPVTNLAATVIPTTNLTEMTTGTNWTGIITGTNLTTMTPVTNMTTMTPVTNMTGVTLVTNLTTVVPVTNLTTVVPVTNMTTPAKPVTNMAIMKTAMKNVTTMTPSETTSLMTSTTTTDETAVTPMPATSVSVESRTDKPSTTPTFKPTGETSEGRSTSDMTSSSKMLTSPMTPTPATSEKLTTVALNTDLQWTTRKPPVLSYFTPTWTSSLEPSTSKVTSRPSSAAGTTLHLMKTTNLLATTPRPFNYLSQQQWNKTPTWLATMTTTEPSRSTRPTDVVTNRYKPTVRTTAPTATTTSTTTTTTTTTSRSTTAEAQLADGAETSASTWNYEFLGDTNPSLTTMSSDLIDTVLPEKTGPIWSVSPTRTALITRTTTRSTTPMTTTTTRRRPPFSRPSSFKPLPIVVFTTPITTPRPKTTTPTVPTDDATWGYLTAGAFGELDKYSPASWAITGSTIRPTAGTFDSDETPAITSNMIDAGVELISIKPEYSKKPTAISPTFQSTLSMKPSTTPKPISTTPKLTTPTWSTVAVKDEENTISDSSKPTSKPSTTIHSVVNFINYSAASATPTLVPTTSTSTQQPLTTRRRPIGAQGPTGPSPGAPVGPSSSFISKPVSVAMAWADSDKGPQGSLFVNKKPSLAMAEDIFVSTPSTVFASSPSPTPLVFPVISTLGSTRRPPSVVSFTGGISPFLPTLATRRPSTSLIEGSHGSTLTVGVPTPKTTSAVESTSGPSVTVSSTLKRTPTPNHPESSLMTTQSTAVNESTSPSTVSTATTPTSVALTNGTLPSAAPGDRIDGSVLAYNAADGAITTTTTTTTTTTRPRPNWDYRLHCGVRTIPKDEQRTGRIVGGKKSNFGDWPWQVLVRESTWLGLFTKNKCGGVLLNAKYVVTAAHCQPGFLASLTVSLGEYDLRGHLEPMRTVERNVKRVVVHRDYEPKTFENDIALLEMDKPVDFRPHIVPICLPEGNEDFVGQEGIVSGWGRIKYGGSVPSVLMQVTVPVMPNPSCQKMFEKAGHPKKIRDSFLCAGFEDGQHDSCEGDSGGPLMRQMDDGRWVLIGTVSHGIKCAWPNLPGIYMKMTYYKPWIMNIINS